MSEQSQRSSIPQAIAEQTRNVRVPPSHLQQLGRDAARRYTQGQPLTEAVISAIGDETLAPAHIRRVCEFANQEAYKAEWDQGGNVRTIEFEGGPADPAVVMRELNDGAREPDDEAAAEKPYVVSDYDREPENKGPVKTAAAGIEDEIFAGYTQPTAHRDAAIDPVPDLVRTHQSLNGAKEHVMSKLSSLQLREQDVTDSLCHEVRKAVLGGESFAKIAYAWARLPEVPRDVIMGMTKTAAAHLVDTGARTYEGIQREFQQEAFAVREPNPDHPLVDQMRTLAKVAQAQQALTGASEVLSGHKQTVSCTLKKHMR